MDARAAYAARINRVVDHIDTHLADALDLETLAAVAHFSPWHFHRVFQAFTGETLGDRVRRRRLETAAERLLMQPTASALAVALDVGFASAPVFTRAFKARFSVTPTAWRQGAWRHWVARNRGALSKIHQHDSKPDQALAAAFRDDAVPGADCATKPSEGVEMNVEIRTLPERRVAYMRYVGPMGDPRISAMWERFAAWSGAHGVADGRHAFIGLAKDNPDITAPDKTRYDACVEVGAGFQGEGEVGVQTIAGGRYACLPFRGTAAEIHPAWMRFYGEWLPGSAWQADDRPPLELYGTGVAVDPKTGTFSCELAVPVRPA